ncbi:MAG: ACT domain-containing protein [Synergistaceae bacterium]|nr:ACT domain-containing protein [Synergistaceae bacterium]MBQ9404311.1 ACT domain-containing protein [Synergistaceae bacterium]
MKLEIQELDGLFAICRLKSFDSVNLDSPFTFCARTDEECSLVCPVECVPDPDDKNILERSDDWRGFRVKGVLDFSLVGILAKISGLLAENDIALFAVSTFNTDYIFVKSDKFTDALNLLNNV